MGLGSFLSPNRSKFILTIPIFLITSIFLPMIFIESLALFYVTIIFGSGDFVLRMVLLLGIFLVHFFLSYLLASTLIRLKYFFQPNRWKLLLTILVLMITLPTPLIIIQHLLAFTNLLPLPGHDGEVLLRMLW